jgi:hypothetical protein
MVSGLAPSIVEKVTQDMKRRFTDHDFDIELTCGLDSSPMRVHVTEFALANEEDSSLTVLVKGDKDDRLRFARRNMAPLALRKTETKTLQYRCLSYVKSMAKKQRETRAVELRPIHPLSRQLLLLILQYNRAQDSSLIVGFNLFPINTSE